MPLVTVTVLASVGLRSEAIGPEPVNNGWNGTYSWRYRTASVTPDDGGVLAPFQRLPRLVLTTATSWQQIGHSYAALALPQANVTAPVRQIADSITTGLNEPRAIAEQLFAWVGDNIEYLPVPLGQSRSRRKPPTQSWSAVAATVATSLSCSWHCSLPRGLPARWC